MKLFFEHEWKYMEKLEDLKRIESEKMIGKSYVFMESMYLDFEEEFFAIFIHDTDNLNLLCPENKLDYNGLKYWWYE